MLPVSIDSRGGELLAGEQALLELRQFTGAGIVNSLADTKSTESMQLDGGSKWAAFGQ